MLARSACLALIALGACAPNRMAPAQTSSGSPVARAYPRSEAEVTELSSAATERQTDEPRISAATDESPLPHVGPMPAEPLPHVGPMPAEPLPHVGPMPAEPLPHVGPVAAGSRRDPVAARQLSALRVRSLPGACPAAPVPREDTVCGRSGHPCAVIARTDMKALIPWTLTLHDDAPVLQANDVMYALQRGRFIGTKMPLTEQLWSMGPGLWAVEESGDHVLAQRWGGRRFEPVVKWPNEGIGAGAFPGTCHEAFWVGSDGKTSYEQWRGRRKVVEVADVFRGEGARAERFAGGVLVQRHADQSVHFATGKKSTRLTRPGDRLVHWTVAGRVPYVMVTTSDGHLALRWLMGNSVKHRQLAAYREVQQGSGNGARVVRASVSQPTGHQLLATDRGVRAFYRVTEALVERRCGMHPSASGKVTCSASRWEPKRTRRWISTAEGPSQSWPASPLPKQLSGEGLVFADRKGRLHVGQQVAYEVMGQEGQSYTAPPPPHPPR